MFRKIAALILFIAMLAVSFYIKSQINAFNMEYYQGKDNGASVQLESILIFSFVFFILLAERNRILQSFVGLVVGIISSIICYISFGTEILFPICASLLIMIAFYLIERILKFRHKKANQ